MGVYVAIVGCLTWVHEQLVSPQVSQMITEVVGDNPAVAKWMRIAIMVTGCLIGARTSQANVVYQAKQRLKKAEARVDRFTKF